MTGLDEDLERLADIGDQVLAGTPIEEFELGEYEILFVAAYCRRGVANYFGEDEAGPGGRER